MNHAQPYMIRLQQISPDLYSVGLSAILALPFCFSLNTSSFPLWALHELVLCLGCFPVFPQGYPLHWVTYLLKCPLFHRGFAMTSLLKYLPSYLPAPSSQLTAFFFLRRIYHYLALDIYLFFAVHLPNQNVSSTKEGFYIILCYIPSFSNEVQPIVDAP